MHVFIVQIKWRAFDRWRPREVFVFAADGAGVCAALDERFGTLWRLVSFVRIADHPRVLAPSA